MKTFIFLWVLLLSLQVLATPNASIRKEVMAKLPAEFSEIKKSQDSTSLKKTFSKKIKKAESDTLYLQYFEKKNDVTIGLKDKRFEYLYLEVPASMKEKFKGLFARAYDKLSESDRKNILSSKSPAHENGRYLEITLPDEGLSLRFDNDDRKDLHSVLYWVPGEKRP